MGSTTVTAGVLDIPQIDFEPTAYTHSVLIRVDALTCNYRDKAIVLSEFDHISIGQMGTQQVTFLGSEFCGTVIEIGVEVISIQKGDRVIPNAQFPDAPAKGVIPGVATNHASVGWLILHESKLVRVPDGIPTSVAAGLSLGCQTAHSMIRRSQVSAQDKVLVTSARSATSLFLIAMLEETGAQVWATSTSPWTDEEKATLPDNVTLVPVAREETYFPNDAFARDLISKGGATAVVDPFFDLHLVSAVTLMSQHGRYISCGRVHQHPALGRNIADIGTKNILNADYIFNMMIFKNLSIIGNCLGSKEDLLDALRMVSEGRLIPPPVDSVFGPDEGHQFLDRSFSSSARLGKVVLDYR
ncbi:alcohol dehydrogenase catalytic domain-containing protein [Corynebacterium timonense]|uniref:alcohol dehydrogenase catalytic domain-containing protein n=1 Tax=Corynebacterium timonense TaxID=441500 RepID=UPI00155FBE40|nr:alcohol dehydrogenase catalytic domain-containing protein [Corynebacterium timonense]